MHTFRWLQKHFNFCKNLFQDPDSNVWLARPLTQDHKPESAMEIGRIQEAGGKVVWKAGVPRVVWNRPKIGHQGPVLRSTHIDEIPFLAVARSLGKRLTRACHRRLHCLSTLKNVVLIR